MPKTVSLSAWPLLRNRRSTGVLPSCSQTRPWMTNWRPPMRSASPAAGATLCPAQYLGTMIEERRIQAWSSSENARMILRFCGSTERLRRLAAVGVRIYRKGPSNFSRLPCATRARVAGLSWRRNDWTLANFIASLSALRWLASVPTTKRSGFASISASHSGQTLRPSRRIV